jgi:hypothetical protein
VDATERKLFFKLWMRLFGWWFVFYLAAYGAAMWALLTLPPGPLKSLLVLAPITPGLGMILGTVQAYLRSDEFIQREILIAAALAALVTAVWTLVYAWLEALGLPHLNVGFVHTIGWPVFIWRMVRLMRLRS